MADEKSSDVTDKIRRVKSALAVVVVAGALGGVLLAKHLDGSGQILRAPSATEAPVAAVPVAGQTITSTHNDAVSDYEAALETGKPVYVLFHSLTCQPCVEISAVVDEVMPEYADRVVFVNAITDDPAGQRLASRFQFQYIPTSFFVTSEGKVADSFTGAMNEGEMKTRLDRLVAQ